MARARSRSAGSCRRSSTCTPDRRHSRQESSRMPPRPPPPTRLQPAPAVAATAHQIKIHHDASLYLRPARAAAPSSSPRAYSGNQAGQSARGILAGALPTATRGPIGAALGGLGELGPPSHPSAQKTTPLSGSRSLGTPPLLWS